MQVIPTCGLASIATLYLPYDRTSRSKTVALYSVSQRAIVVTGGSLHSAITSLNVNSVHVREITSHGYV